MAKLKKYGWHILFLFVGLVASLGLIGFFSMRAAAYSPYRKIDEPIRPWMTLPYVAHSYRVPSYVLFEALGLPHLIHDRRPIVRIAHDVNLPVDEVIAKLQDAIVHSRPPYPTPLPAPASIPTPSIQPTPGAQ